MQLSRGTEATVLDAVLTGSRALVAMAARSLADVDEDVTLTQYRSLVVLASRGPQSMTALADALSVSTPTASRLAERLVRKGLVRRRTERHDRRQVRLALTPTGRALVDLVTERRRREIAELLTSIDTELLDNMAAGLRQLAAAAGEVPDQDWSSGWDL